MISEKLVVMVYAEARKIEGRIRETESGNPDKIRDIERMEQRLDQIRRMQENIMKVYEYRPSNREDSAKASV